MEIAPDIDVRWAKIKAKAESANKLRPVGSLDIKSNFTLTAGCACHLGPISEPLPDRRSFETD
jgi:hypothetical protein